MKRIIVLLLALTLLCGCAPQGAGREIQYEKPTKSTTAPATKTASPSTETQAETEPPVQLPPMSTSFPYTISAPAEACVFTMPDPDSKFVQTIGQDGIYTITEEARSENGDIWGKLKSGLGWINLTNPYCSGSQVPAVTCSYTGNEVLQRNIITYRSGYDWPYLTFHVHTTITDVQLIETNHDEYVKTHYTAPLWQGGSFLIIQPSFPFDFSAMTLSYYDSNGQYHSIFFKDSLKDGTIYFVY